VVGNTLTAGVIVLRLNPAWDGVRLRTRKGLLPNGSERELQF
jgi:hypothetical protein